MEPKEEDIVATCHVSWRSGRYRTRCWNRSSRDDHRDSRLGRTQVTYTLRSPTTAQEEYGNSRWCNCVCYRRASCR
ncbi:uncharacterized protein LOC141914561 isoform X3 [Tubulanus polymorphus]|uniref:uncharacterized protein LOC141914561 isoform X3 n=1 Tax=Tubulanus polymorphus TaxID=672921 RepID=UPI003DA5B6DD